MSADNAIRDLTMEKIPGQLYFDLRGPPHVYHASRLVYLSEQTTTRPFRPQIFKPPSKTLSLSNVAIDPPVLLHYRHRRLLTIRLKRLHH